MHSLEATESLDRLDRNAVESLVREYWAARIEDRQRALDDYVADDAVFKVLSAPGLGSSVRRGRAEIEGAMRAFDRELSYLTFRIDDVIVDRRRAAVLWEAVLRNRGTGSAGRIRAFELVGTRGALIETRSVFHDDGSFARLIDGEPPAWLAQPPPPDRRAVVVGGSVRAEALPPAETRPLIARYFEGISSQSGDGAAAFFAEDAVFDLVGDPATVPFARRRVGREAIKAMFREINVEFEFQMLDLLEVLVEGARAAAHWQGRLRHRGTGAIAMVDALDHIVLDGDRIVSVSGFFDTTDTALAIAG